MNNSGETETFKFSGYTSQLIPGQGAGSYRTLNSGAPNPNPSVNDIIIGNNARTTGGGGGIAIGPNAVAGANIRKGVAIGGDVSAALNGINVGWTSTADGDGACALGILNNASSESSVAVGAVVNTTGVHAIGIGRDVNSTGLRSVAIAPNTTVSRENSCAVGGNAHSVSNGKRQSIFGGVSNTISSSNDDNTILGGNGNTIGGTTSGSTLVGCIGKTALYDNTTHVENLHTYRTPSTQVQPISSGTTFTCNLENGAKSQFYITGTSTVNITNVRDGASFMIKTQTDGNHNMTWTATGGYTFVFEGGIKDPGNNVTDIFVFEVFGSVIYGNRRHNYS